MSVTSDDLSVRPQRADARRNHDALVRAATAQFEERGVDSSLEDIARRAGVGIGTLYRHFPTRDALVEAVYRAEVDALCGGVDDLLATRPSDEALAEWMTRFAAYVARKRGMATALKAIIATTDSDLFDRSREKVRGSVHRLVAAAAADGRIRADVDSDDLLGAMSGICMATDTPGWADRTATMVSLLVDGLRYGAPHSG